jgi:NitT/TauT family transport system substrate-binding protein
MISFQSPTISESKETIRIGTLQYGSVNWELDLIKKLESDKKFNVDVEIVQLASKNAAAVALQGNSVDLIVTDWFWVSRQRTEKRMFSFIPHSMAAGGIMVNQNSELKKIDDLKGKKIGIAGGQIDKSWLIFRAYYLEKFGEDLVNVSEQVYGAPPLLNKKIEQGSFDAILTYWPYQARLKTKDFVKVISVKDVIKKLGIDSNVPVIGWVFRDEWAIDNSSKLKRFIQASEEAKELMMNSDEVWESIKPSMRVKNEDVFISLREIYREGIPRGFGQNQVNSAAKLFNKLSIIGGKALVGNSTSLAKGTFWLQ